MTIPKPNLFIGSSREAIKYARAIHEQIKRSAQVTPWYGGTFGANMYTMEALEKQLASSDFGVFVFSPDDVALIRGKHVFVTRDNTLFEMGLYWGRLGRRRVYCIIPDQVEADSSSVQDVIVKDYHLLSDLQGITLLEYELRSDDDYKSAVDVACGHILSAIETEGFYNNPSTLIEQKDAELRRKQSVLHFFWEYNRNVHVSDEAEKYHALSEAVRNSLLPPAAGDFRVTGAAFWGRRDEGIAQIGGNVGKGRYFPFDGKKDHSPSNQSIYVIDVYNSGKWAFYHEEEVAQVYVFCYPLGVNHVLSVHFTGHEILTDEDLAEVVEQNRELLRTIRHLVGGDSS
ncbi:Predicted nucleotide-binding protein containing TIR-like domain-containing protein [Paenibacillus sp. cl141a]|uniref:TIR domain-containing protein n=1 Tax=Bacillales TaxID=1385 RepID=UPI0001788D58|nr:MULTISPECIES: nucleotide-binding protein [Paenibacillus]ACX67409.1 nucleotide-binding protein-like protein containing TIR-like domain [Paenibacillus sp. Y412MC10]ETT63878.1 nucleotide-binding protein-like protein containing TIR-like domain [Paenibacillus sp. FSL H8-457]MCM3259863.1 nucleotide-binding protein [Paenibacillus lautus]PCL90858.1 nucleotide-binding protein [Paenibacillus lautus]QOT13676.1 nucleotide-binding protein [Paenibacillus sp. JNUCC-32]